MNITLSFDPSSTDEVERLADVLRKTGVFDIIMEKHKLHIEALPIHMLSNGSSCPSLDYRVTDALASAGIKTIRDFYETFGTKNPIKIKGVSDVAIERGFAAINRLFADVS